MLIDILQFDFRGKFTTHSFGMPRLFTKLYIFRKCHGRGATSKQRTCVRKSWKEKEQNVGVIFKWTITMSLQVLVIKATNVPNAEKFGESDPYVSLEYKGKDALFHTWCLVNRAFVFWTQQNLCISKCLIYRSKEEDWGDQVEPEPCLEWG